MAVPSKFLATVRVLVAVTWH